MSSISVPRPSEYIDLAGTCSSWTDEYQPDVSYFADNLFVISGSPQRSLTDLKRLPPNVLSSLRSLRVLHIRFDDSAAAEFREDEHPAGIVAATVEEWDQVCTWLGSRLAPDQVRLSVYCNLGKQGGSIESTYAAAKRITRPLLKLPRLRGCAVHLAVFRDQWLKTLARTTVEAVLREKIGEAPVAFVRLPPFPFMSLPPELRCRVLMFAGLDLAYHTAPPPDSDVKLDSGKLHSSHGRRVCCGNCRYLGNGHWGYDTFECFCLGTGSAFSPSCDCPFFPKALLFLDRRTHLEASGVFWSSNRFRFAGDLRENLVFLQRVPEYCLWQMRNVIFDFNTSAFDTDESGRPVGHHCWAEMVGLMRQKTNLSGLTLEIHYDWEPESCLLSSIREAVEQVESNGMEPSMRFNGLQYLSCPHSYISAAERGVIAQTVTGNRYTVASETGRWEDNTFIFPIV